MNIEPRTLAGFMELLPNEQILFEQMKQTIEKTYQRFGFLPLDTPILELSEVLLAKAGGETEKQIYRFTKGDTDIIKKYSDEQQRGITFIEQKEIHDTVTYKEFYNMVLCRLAYLQSCGLHKGDKIILQCSNNKDLALSFWACILGGMIPIPLALAINEEQIVKLVNVWYRIGDAKILFNAEIMVLLKDKLDANDIHITTDKISKRFDVINNVDTKKLTNHDE